MARPEQTSSPLRIAASWTLVLIPMGWGVVQSVTKSLPLFQTHAASNPKPTSTSTQK